MSLTNDNISSQAQSQTKPSCPYIGILSDPQTRVGIADARNCCHLVNPASSIDFRHQESYCLSKDFPACPIYQTSGEGPIPSGILNDGSQAQKALKLGLFSKWRSSMKDQKGNQSTAEVEDEILFTKAVEAEKSETMNPPIAEVGGVAAATEQFSSEEFPAESAVDDDEELRMRLYNEALTRYEQANSGKKEKKGLWAFLLVVALVVLLFSVWGVYNRIQNLQQQALINAEINYTISLATAVQDMSAAADAWATAAGLIEQEQLTATAVAIQTEAARQTALAIGPDLLTATVAAMTATPTEPLKICSDITQAQYEVVSGPQLNPPTGTVYQASLPNPQASWIVKNTGTCGWSQIYLWAVFDNLVVQPIIKHNGQVIDATVQDEKNLIKPGDQIEVILEIPISEAQQVEGEWVLVVDGLSLFDRPKLILKAFNWILVVQVDRATATRTPKPREPGATSGPPSREEPPPPRETP